MTNQELNALKQQAKDLLHELDFTGHLKDGAGFVHLFNTLTGRKEDLTTHCSSCNKRRKVQLENWLAANPLVNEVPTEQQPIEQVSDKEAELVKLPTEEEKQEQAAEKVSEYIKASGKKKKDEKEK